MDIFSSIQAGFLGSEIKPSRFSVHNCVTLFLKLKIECFFHNYSIYNLFIFY